MAAALPALDLAYKPDAAQAVARMEAWWRGEVLDRPCVQVSAPKPGRHPVIPAKTYASHRDRWLDLEYRLAVFDAQAAATWYGGELLPFFNPNLGPEIMAAAYGCELDFTESTSWSVPCLKDWAKAPELRFDANNFYIQKVLEFIRLSLQVGQGKFLTGLTDMHPGGDLAAALRDPINLCADLLTDPAEVKALLGRLHHSFFTFYEMQHALLRAAGQRLTTTWLPLYGLGRYYVPSNDFSCTVSTAMFEEFFMPELRDEWRWLDYSIYHLDGPDALRHLDLLLAEPRLQAIQFVWGAGGGKPSRWLKVFQKIQAAGKCQHLSVSLADVDELMPHLKPDGICFNVWAPSIEAGEALIQKVAKWR